ncbi:MAG: TonB-dependent receptor plug domain-containing protein [Sphingomonadales bacterium]|nr:TonB-dependent receptor plug domain-containing protein [Sphingomonadales bacterium]MDE2167929.1 TonB-dependent receptor plug domain-containing protein [Sphingomonadales bacterium]
MRRLETDKNTKTGHKARKALMLASMLTTVALSAPAFAGDANAPAKPDAPASTTDADDQGKQDIVVQGSLDALPLKDVGSIFGFSKTLVETPRSASTVSKEQLDRFAIYQIYDLVSQSPGTFTSSFFGTGGALDIRGAPSDVYYRGMLRLDNPGNYSTPIGAADRIDIVRGPASVIYGPSKIGGYINFVPKTARAANGTYSAETKGDVEVDLGSWGRKVLKGSITGPGKVLGQEFGYSLYGEVEDSDSYYRNVFTKNALFSAAFDTDITPNLRAEFGGTWQKYNSVQNSGWNRVTQDLINNGTYVTGQGTSLDANGDGKISREEAYAANGGNGLGWFGSFNCGVPSVTASGYSTACFQGAKDFNLVNAGTTHLSMRDTLTGTNDKLNNVQKTGYFDLTWSGKGDLKIKNQLFYDGGVNLNENAYGFAQAFSSYVIEDKIVLSDSFDTKFAKISVQASPSLRYTHFNFADDYGVELWNRPDISLADPYTPQSTRLLSTQCGCDYSDYVYGYYLDTGIAGLVDVDTKIGFDLIGGVRYDSVHSKSTAWLSKYDPTNISSNVGAGYGSSGTASASDTEGAVSWNASLSYKSPIGLIPYITVSRQSTVVAGEGSELYLSNILSGNVLGKSNLLEGGLKGEFLNKKLYAAVSVYNQKRTQAGAESSLTNQILQTKGVEAEVRWSVDKHLLVTASYTHMHVQNVGALAAGSYFNYFGAGDFPGINPALTFGGSQFGLLPITKTNADRPGEPKNVVSATATYAFDNGIALSGDLTHVDAVWLNYAQTVRLPAYWLLNLGVSYSKGPWLFRAGMKNVSNSRYFRAGGQDLFGADIVLPQMPRSWTASIKYKF